MQGPTSASSGSFIACNRCSASTNLSIADSPSSGYAECAIFPCATSSTCSAPLLANASLFSVGSPLIRKRAPIGCWLAVFAPMESRSSPTRNSKPTKMPPPRNFSAARIWAAIIPFASHAPRPYIRPSSSDDLMNGGTVSMWVEKTISGRACPGHVASTFAREPSTGIFQASNPRRRNSPKRKSATALSFGVMDSMSIRRRVSADSSMQEKRTRLPVDRRASSPGHP